MKAKPGYYILHLSNHYSYTRKVRFRKQFTRLREAVVFMNRHVGRYRHPWELVQLIECKNYDCKTIFYIKFKE